MAASRRTISSSSRRSTFSPNSAGQTANLLGEFAGKSPEGRASKRDAILPARLRLALKKLNPGLPGDALDDAYSAVPASAWRSTPFAPIPRSTNSCARASGWRSAARMADTDRDRPRHRLGRPGSERLLPREPGLVRGRALHQARRPRRLRQRPAASLRRAEGEPQGDGRRLQRQSLRLSRDDPPGLHAKRLRHPLERARRGARRAVRAARIFQRMEADRRRGGDGRRQPRHADQGHVPAGAVPRHRRELHRLRGGQARPRQENWRRPTSCSASIGRSVRSTISRTTGGGSASSGTRKARARAFRCCSSRARFCARSRATGRF